MADHDLASLGDAFISILYSLALSNKRRKPSGAKVKGNALAEALKNAGLRKYLPARMTRHMLVDSAGSTNSLCLASKLQSVRRDFVAPAKTDNLVENLNLLPTAIRTRIKFS